MIGELFVVWEALLGAALLLVWAAIEVIGYAGLVCHLVLTCASTALAALEKPSRDARWGTAVRAAGLSSRRQQHA